MDERHKFLYLFWFCVFVFTVSFAAMMALLFLGVPVYMREQAANAQGFLQGSLIMSAVGFLLTGSIANNIAKKQDVKTTTEITPDTTTITTEPIKAPTDEKPTT